MALGNPSIEQAKLPVRDLLIKCFIQGHTTQASIRTWMSGGPAFRLFHEDDARTLTDYDASAGFALTDLDNDAVPAVVGVILSVGDAAEIVEVSVPATSIICTSLTDPMTAGVVTLKGASSTGVTASGNISFTISLTGLNIDEDIATSPNCVFWVKVKYRTTQPGY